MSRLPPDKPPSMAHSSFAAQPQDASMRKISAHDVQPLNGIDAPQRELLHSAEVEYRDDEVALTDTANALDVLPLVDLDAQRSKSQDMCDVVEDRDSEVASTYKANIASHDNEIACLRQQIATVKAEHVALEAVEAGILQRKNLIAMLQREADDESAKLQQLKAKQEVLHALRDGHARFDWDVHAQRTEQQVLWSIIRSLEADKTQMDRDRVAGVLALSIGKGTELDNEPLNAEQLAQVYKEGRNMGYLEAARDLDLKYALSSLVKEDYAGFDKSQAPTHIVDLNNVRHPYNRGKEVGHMVLGAALAVRNDIKALDLRVYQSPNLTDDLLFPYRKKGFEEHGFWKGLQHGAEARGDEWRPQMKKLLAERAAAEKKAAGRKA